jgi:RNA-directed DNA polymerase
VHLVRFADDFVVTGTTKGLLKEEVQPVIERFLAERGLTLSVTKTRITHINEGFDFLGQNLRKYDHKLLIRPSDSSVKEVLANVQKVLKANPQARAGPLIMQLNPIIRGWANYHRHVVSKKTFIKIDWHIRWTIWKWARKKHRGRSAAWVKEKYFKKVGNLNWVFTGMVGNADGRIWQVQLCQASKISIKRHCKIKETANPYDPEWELYFEERHRQRMIEELAGNRRLLKLWLEQEGQCPICRQKLVERTDWHIHHIRERVEGGDDTLDNLVLLHPNCHRQVHSQGWVVSKPRPVRRTLAKA